jgi:hypothetical protein
VNDYETRLAVRDRDGQRCTQCGMTADQHREEFGRTLDVHRIDPGQGYSLENCVTLCRPCHGPKPRSSRGYGRHKWSADKRAINISERVMQVIDQIAERNCMTPPQVVHELIRERLQQLNLWPKIQS